MVMTVEPSAFAAQEMRSREWARTTPGWLRVVSVTLAGLMVATGAFAVLAMLARQRATGAARNTAEPLLVDAQQIDVELSDANTTIAGGFLAGPVLPAADRARFQGDMAAAAAALAAAGQRAGTDPGVSRLLQTLSTGLPTYTGIVATSEVNNQEQFPVAAAYLAEANNLAGATLLPAASALYNTERARLVNDDSKATGLPLLLVVFVLLGITLIASVWLQISLSRRFRRYLNLPVLLATGLVAAATVWLGVAVAAEGGAVHRAERQGTNPLTVLTRARISAQQARADDELTLATRDAVASYQKDYPVAATAVTSLAGTAPPGWTATEAQYESTAVGRWRVYLTEHAVIRAQDSSGDLQGAIAADRSSAEPLAGQADAAFGQAVNAAVTSFDQASRAASGDLSGLAWGCFALLVAAAVAVLVGVEPRIREYR